MVVMPVNLAKFIEIKDAADNTLIFQLGKVDSILQCPDSKVAQINIGGQQYFIANEDFKTLQEEIVGKGKEKLLG